MRRGTKWAGCPVPRSRRAPPSLTLQRTELRCGSTQAGLATRRGPVTLTWTVPHTKSDAERSPCPQVQYGSRTLNLRADQCKPRTTVSQLRSGTDLAPRIGAGTRNGTRTSEQPRLQFRMSLAPRISRPTGMVHAPRSQGFSPTRNLSPRTEGGVRNGSRTSNGLAPNSERISHLEFAG